MVSLKFVSECLRAGATGGLAAMLILLALARAEGADPGSAPALSPRHWPKTDLERYSLLNLIYDMPRPLAEGREEMIGGSSGPLAIHAGQRALEQGGTAADAAIATALAQIVLTAGSWNSFAGILYVVYYDSASGKVHSLNAGYNTIRAETDPLSIPLRPNPSGRTALVPGFMAGAEAIHKRFGRLPFGELFEPAIYFAEEGIVVDPSLAGMMAYCKDVLGRRAETRDIFFKKDGAPYRKGDIFRQPALAQTLRAVVSRGAGVMYTGEWAGRFVEAVRGEGGKVTLDDLRGYEALWVEPLKTTYGGYEVYTIGLPEIGGVHLAELLNLLELSNPKPLGHYSRSGEALVRFIQACRLGPIVSTSKQGIDVEHPEAEFSPQNRVTKEAARRNWTRIQKKGWELELYGQLNKPMGQGPPVPPEGGEGHSDAIVVADRYGNVAALLHSINTRVWGTTGIFVGGVSIPDSASFQQRRLAQVKPGARFPNISNPVIVLQDGRPALACGCIGAALHECMAQNLVNILDFGMDPKSSAETPNFMGMASIPSSAGAEMAQFVGKGDFAESLLKQLAQRGVRARELDGRELLGHRSTWIGLQIGPNRQWIRGFVAPGINGIMEAR